MSGKPTLPQSKDGKPRATSRRFSWDIANKETTAQRTEPIASESNGDKTEQVTKIPAPVFIIPEDIRTRRSSLESTPPQYRPRAESNSGIPTPKFGSSGRDSRRTSFDGTATPPRSQRSGSISLVPEASALATSVEAALNKQFLMQPARSRVFFLFENALEKSGFDTKLIKENSMLLLTAIVGIPQGELTTTANLAKGLYKNIASSIPKLKLADVETALAGAFEQYNQKKPRTSLITTPPQLRTRRGSTSVPSSPVAGATEPPRDLEELHDPLTVPQITMHISHAEPSLGENKVSGATAAKKALSADDNFAFNQARNPNLHKCLHNLSANKEHKPWVKKNGEYAIQVALRNLTITSLATPSVYDYMMYSIDRINNSAESDLPQQLTQQELHKLVPSNMMKSWMNYVKNFGVTCEEMSK
jgi:hypothetical protein